MCIAYLSNSPSKENSDPAILCFPTLLRQSVPDALKSVWKSEEASQGCEKGEAIISVSWTKWARQRYSFSSIIIKIKTMKLFLVDRFNEYLKMEKEELTINEDPADKNICESCE